MHGVGVPSVQRRGGVVIVHGHVLVHRLQLVAEGGVDADGARSRGDEDPAACGTRERCRHVQWGSRGRGDSHFFFGQSA